MQKTIGINQFKFDGGVQGINVISEFKQFRQTLGPEVEKMISILPPEHRFQAPF